jgi:hypothetical protein
VTPQLLIRKALPYRLKMEELVILITVILIIVILITVILITVALRGVAQGCQLKDLNCGRQTR